MPRLVTLLLVATAPLSISHAQDSDNKQNQRETYAKLRRLAQPGSEHAELKQLVGTWKVSLLTRGNEVGFIGTATSEMILGDRFLVIDGNGKAGNWQSAFRYTVGFDRRHEEYVIIAMDTAGTYHVSARGKSDRRVESKGNVIRMFGVDDDPHMKSMGFTKKFAFDLAIEDQNAFSIVTLFVDTRTDEEKLDPAMEYRFSRADDDQ